VTAIAFVIALSFFALGQARASDICLHAFDPTKMSLDQWIGACRAELALIDRNHDAAKWDETEFGLAWGLFQHGNQARQKSELEEAVVDFRLVLQDWTEEKHRDMYALANLYLGGALEGVSDYTNDRATEEQGVAAFRAALKSDVRARAQQIPGDQENLGEALVTLSRFDAGKSKIEDIKQGIACYNAALGDEKYPARDRVKQELQDALSKIDEASRREALSSACK
jgi:hypothetical protein